MPPTHADRLVDHLIGGGSDLLATDLRAWVERSRPFRAFADANRDKIRKKVRSTSEGEARLDLRAELAVAHALLGDRRMAVTYESYGSTAGGPDFTVTFRGHVTFNVEVTRWRGERHALRRQLAVKLGQLPPSIANVVLIAADGGDEAALDRDALAAAVADVDDATRAPDLRQRVRRLSAMVAWDERRIGSGRANLWTNPTARNALPDAAARALLTALHDERSLPMDRPPASR